MSPVVVVARDVDRSAPASVLRRGGWAVEGVEAGSPQIRDVLATARSRGIVSVVMLDDLRARDPIDFASADAIIVPTRFAKEYYAEALGLRCDVVPALVTPDLAISEVREPRFLTFVDPSAANGAYVFARVAEELARLRPDIPILIVGARGSGVTLAGCGIDILAQANITLKERSTEPRDHWRVTRLALVPTLAWDASPRVAFEALANGIPVVGSDRGSMAEAATVAIPVPGRITPASKTLPTAEEVTPWVEAIVGLWDRPGLVEKPSIDALSDFVRNLKPTGLPPRVASTPGRSRAVVLVPHFNGIDRPCEEALRVLESSGVRVVRSEGCPQIDIARNMMASDALKAGAESIFFIDADLGFDPIDALRLLARPDPVVSGVYARKNRRGLSSVFADGTAEVAFGLDSPGDYPLKYAAGGFLRIKAEVLRRMVVELDLPACNTGWGRLDYPFFLPLIVTHADGTRHYLGEDWAFSHRLAQIGVTPLADTSIRLWHHGTYAYGWEDAGAGTTRHSSYVIKLDQG